MTHRPSGTGKRVWCDGRRTCGGTDPARSCCETRSLTRANNRRTETRPAHERSDGPAQYDEHGEHHEHGSCDTTLQWVGGDRGGGDHAGRLSARGARAGRDGRQRQQPRLGCWGEDRVAHELGIGVLQRGGGERKAVGHDGAQLNSARAALVAVLSSSNACSRHRTGPASRNTSARGAGRRPRARDCAGGWGGGSLDSGARVLDRAELTQPREALLASRSQRRTGRPGALGGRPWARPRAL